MLCIFQSLQCPSRSGDRRPSWCSPCVARSGRAIQGDWRSFWKNQPRVRTRFSSSLHLEANKQCPIFLVFPSPIRPVTKLGRNLWSPVPVTCQTSLLLLACPSLCPELQQNSPRSRVSTPKPALAAGGCEMERGNINPKPKPGAGSRLRYRAKSEFTERQLSVLVKAEPAWLLE